MKIDVWRAIFSDYRDLSIGTLYHKDTGAQAYSGMAADFEVVNKMHLDAALRRIEKLRQELTNIHTTQWSEVGIAEERHLVNEIVKKALREDDEAAK